MRSAAGLPTIIDVIAGAVTASHPKQGSLKQDRSADLAHRAINRNHDALDSVLRAGYREKPVSTFSPGALNCNLAALARFALKPAFHRFFKGGFL
jgi:hypothetical protein